VIVSALLQLAVVFLAIRLIRTVQYATRPYFEPTGTINARRSSPNILACGHKKTRRATRERLGNDTVLRTSRRIGTARGFQSCKEQPGQKCRDRNDRAVPRQTEFSARKAMARIGYAAEPAGNLSLLRRRRSILNGRAFTVEYNDREC
jgi:hypothetical protein